MVGLLAATLLPLGAGSSVAQTGAECRRFAETGKDVCGRFLEYWSANGGLPQQGLPLSGTMQERSDTDGKTYTVQYFERAVFEAHPQNAKPYDVLLSLLGTMRFREKYPSGRASGVVAGQGQPGTCAATHDDSDNDSGRFFSPLTPERQVVGRGLVLTGRVLSSANCAPIAGVRLEMRPEVNNDHPASQHAALYTDAEGRYRLESDFPHHIHMKVSAHGFRQIFTNLYHTMPGKAVDTFDIVLVPDPTCRRFTETGQALCGAFLDYWQRNGALPQQGFPISGEFIERSDLNGKEYKVQYFERAVFEAHPDNRPPYDVLLSQLGTFRYNRKHGAGESGTLRETGSMTTARACHSATVLRDGRVLVAGGMERNDVFRASTEIYDPATRTFRPGGNLLEARACHAAVPLDSGRVLILGGSNNQWLGSTEIYDPATGRSLAGPTMAVRRGDVTATRLTDGRILVAGGYDGTRYASAEIYDPATNRFTPTGSMMQPRSGQTATLLRDGRVLLAGGTGVDKGAVAHAELYDPRTGRFTSTGSLSGPRRKHGAALLPDGKVLIIGGSDSRDWRGRYSSTELYDPDTGRFSPASAMANSRFKMGDATVTLRDGRVFVGGGSTQAEVYDPKAARFSALRGSVDADRFFSSAALLPDGGVLIAGGYSYDIEATAKAWVVEP
jgi:hypothetical protein